MREDIQQLLPKFLDLLLDAVCVVDTQGRFVFVNAASERIFGYTSSELLGTSMIDLVYPDDRERTISTAQKVMNGQPVPHFENRYIHKNGHLVDIMWSASWSATEGMRLAVARDITQVRRAERLQKALYDISEAAHTAANLTTLYRHIHQIITTLLPAQSFCVTLYHSNNNEVVFPYYVDQLQRSYHSRELVEDEPLAKVILGGKPLLIHGPLSGASSSQLPPNKLNGLDWLGIPLISADSVIGALVLQHSTDSGDYSEQSEQLLHFVSVQIANAITRKQTETRLLHLANHDALTNLANRSLFNVRFDFALKQAQRENQQMALLYIDLDKFKMINDTLGHEVGDGVLVEFSQRLVAGIRYSDTAGRMGGDEFTLLLVNIHGQRDVELVADKLNESIEKPMIIRGHTINITASIGLAIYPFDGINREQLSSAADTDMYRQKNDAQLKQLKR
ncbi:diguanylate cyclase [uncultured Paraglaciecola sp.]|uniref:sensor domain-containing protein n=1 Tax=uncultured Paraglaciecola sp. TaxID=1765024 RepID=UPI0030D70F70|tara:strand:+ start:1675 stop:3024 length:1350 start_codon:yes stop_codon:yes gene_type:complete